MLELTWESGLDDVGKFIRLVSLILKAAFGCLLYSLFLLISAALFSGDAICSLQVNSAKPNENPE